jgi:Fe-Mn family superoxide dismutase
MDSDKIDRRSFLALSGSAVAVSMLAAKVSGAPMSGSPMLGSDDAVPFTLMKLPYADSALAPVISTNTMGFHYGKHHKGYVNKLNELTKGTPFAEMTLENVVKQAAADKSKIAVYNNAAQIWNHNFYWNSMKANGGGKPPVKLAQKIDEAFGTFDKFKKEFSDTTISQFGTGWGWLVADTAGKLKIVKTGDADAPFLTGLKPLLTIDVWEHAYYLDYQNRRADYVNAVIDKLLNWDFALENLAK